MKSFEIRESFLNFFKTKGHTIVPSSSLIPDDSSVLFTTAGMQQFKPYYLGIKSPYGPNVASSQKCFRTSDIDSVGDNSHLTFLEMLGNFSFGGYFKKESIEMAYHFLKDVCGINKEKLSVTVFGGDNEVPKDYESLEIWKKFGFSPENNNLKFSGREDNFWGPTGIEGPCGPTTEIYINGIEVWNLVFNEYFMDKSKKLTFLKQKGVDTGMGLERLTMIIQNKNSVFETDLLFPIIQELEKLSSVHYEGNLKAYRIIADHIRSSVFLISDGIMPSNIERGYVLRRILRRAIRYGKLLDTKKDFLIPLAQKVIFLYGNFYPEVKESKDRIVEIIQKEEEKFEKTLEKGLRQFEKISKKDISGEDAFHLYDTYGFPIELTQELAKEKDIKVDYDGFKEAFEKHKEISRAGVEKKFGGHGLILDTGEIKAKNDKELQVVVRLHTATHLLQAALRKILGDQVKQAGSDITFERTRFDFTFHRKLTKEEIKAIEDLVNEKIKEDLPVKFLTMPLEEAKKTGALSFFKQKYPQIVKIYYIGESLENAFSKEFCGGPHVKRTLEIGKFKIIKEEAVSSGVRRIRAVVY
jgi:alanyl-tRNA synthetase